MPTSLGNTNNHPSAESDDDPDNDDFVEVSEDEFPSFFAERNGRLFHSQGTAPYPLPVDTPEQERMTVLHKALFRLIGANYVGPVPEVLAEEAGRRKQVLDLGTGTGRWVTEMASEFPHAMFRGFDIVPIATRYPPPNVQFDMHDISKRSHWGDHTVDFVHARSISMTVQDYSGLLREVGRILRPNGLFLSCEWGRYCAFDPSYPSLPAQIPALSRFFSLLQSALHIRRGIAPVAPTVPQLLNNSGLFRDITAQDFVVPWGSWHPDPQMRRLGRVFRAVFLRYASSVRPLISEIVRGDELEEIYGVVRNEVMTVPGLVSIFHTVHARRA